MLRKCRLVVSAYRERQGYGQRQQQKTNATGTSTRSSSTTNNTSSTSNSNTSRGTANRPHRLRVSCPNRRSPGPPCCLRTRPLVATPSSLPRLPLRCHRPTVSRTRCPRYPAGAAAGAPIPPAAIASHLQPRSRPRTAALCPDRAKPTRLRRAPSGAGPLHVHRRFDVEGVLSETASSCQIAVPRPHRLPEPIRAPRGTCRARTPPTSHRRQHRTNDQVWGLRFWSRFLNGTGGRGVGQVTATSS